MLKKHLLNTKILWVCCSLTLIVLAFSACSKKVIPIKGDASSAISSQEDLQEYSSQQLSSQVISSKPSEVMIPDVVGSDTNTAISKISELGLIPKLNDVTVMSDGSSKSPKYKLGTITEITPKADTPAKIGSTVTCNTIKNITYSSPYYAPSNLNLKNFVYQFIIRSVDVDANGVLTIDSTFKYIQQNIDGSWLTFDSASAYQSSDMTNGIKGSIVATELYSGKEIPVTFKLNLENSTPNILYLKVPVNYHYRKTTTEMDPFTFNLNIDWSRSKDDVKSSDTYDPSAPRGNN